MQNTVHKPGNLQQPITIGTDLYITNLPGLVEGGLPPVEGIGAGWIPFDYTLDDFSGIGLATGALSPAGELVLDLQLTGWHVLHFCHSGMLDIWLDGENGARLIDGLQGALIRDYPLHRADMTGRKLHLAPKRGLDPREATLFYIRAVPCDGPRPNARNLVATEDGADMYRGLVTTARDIYRCLSPYRDSDFFRILWGVYGGGDRSADAQTPFTCIRYGKEHWCSPSDQMWDSAISGIHGEGRDPLAVAVDAAHDIGIEIHFYFRVAAFYAPFPHHGCTSRFYANNPQWRCRDEFGREVKRISYAFRETQDYLLSYFEDLLKYAPDGICLAFNRGLPLMVCEEPVLDEFKRRYGRAARLPEEVDSPEMLAVRQELLADFVARVHALLAQRGKALSCVAPRNFAGNLLRGLDIELCVKRGLFESVNVGADPVGGEQPPPGDPDDLEPLLRLQSHGTASIYVGGADDCFPDNDIATQARRMRAIHDAGLDGGFFWDARRHWLGRHWEHIRRYGDPEYLEQLLQDRISAPVERDTMRIHDLTIDRYNPWNAG